MCAPAIFLGCLVCGGLGRRVQLQSEPLRGRSRENQWERIDSAGVSGLQFEPIKALFLAFNLPAAGPRLSGQNRIRPARSPFDDGSRSSLLKSKIDAPASVVGSGISVVLGDVSADALSEFDKIVKVVKADIPQILRKEPDWDVFSEDFKVIDSDGAKLEGLESCKSLLKTLSFTRKPLFVREDIQFRTQRDQGSKSSLVAQWKFRLGRVNGMSLPLWWKYTPIMIEMTTTFYLNEQNKLESLVIDEWLVNGRKWFWPQIDPNGEPRKNLKVIRAWARDIKDYDRRAAKLASMYTAAAARAGVALPAIDVKKKEELTDAETPKRRILLVIEPTPFTYVSGYKNRFQALIKYLLEAGDELLIITTGPNAPSEFLGARVLQAPTFSNAFSGQVPETYAYSPKLWRAVMDFQPHLVHSANPATATIGAIVYARKLGVPMVISYHTDLKYYIDKYCGPFAGAMLRLYWFLMRNAHGRAELTLTTSQQALDLIPKELVWSGFSNWSADGLPNPMQVWSKGVDSDVFHPRFDDAAMRSRLTDGHPESPLLVHVGRLGPEKNLYFIKDIMRKLADSHGLPDVRLAVVGDGPEAEGLRKHYEDTPTVFTGPLSGDELSQAYASADVFVMPSESETLGFVVLEAMASQTAVVAVRAGGIPDIIQRDNEIGFLYPPGDLEAAAAQVATLLKDKSLREQVALAGREEVSQYDWRAATNKIRKQYDDATRLHEFRLSKRV